MSLPPKQDRRPLLLKKVFAFVTTFTTKGKIYKRPNIFIYPAKLYFLYIAGLKNLKQSSFVHGQVMETG